MENGVDARAVVQELRNVFATGVTRSLKWRVEQLKGLARFAKERESEIGEALRLDLNKPPFEVYSSEVSQVVASAEYAAKNLAKWMKPEKVSVPILAFPGNAEVVTEPLGVALVISAWNFPILLALDPVIGAIAAGCAVALKPSELAPASAALLSKLIPLYVDPSAIRVVEGGVPAATALLEQKWDKIFYTGSTRVGRIIMAAAAKHLTPVTLELGGKSPTIVDSTADLDVAAKRICWGKWSTNNGQACISPDYILAEESIVPKLMKALERTLQEFYGEDPSTAEISRVINNIHWKRLTGYLNEEGVAEKVVLGGGSNEKTLYIAPTLVLDPPLDSNIMQDEVFGPIMVVKTVRNIEEAISFINARPKPLALYVFTNNQKVKDQVVLETSSGGVIINDTMLNMVVSGLPFGGVGDSGMGGYHGKHSFDVFSHKKGVLSRGFRGDNPMRYPPYTSKKQNLVRCIMTGNFWGLILTLIGFK